jgi:hypothetical protein
MAALASMYLRIVIGDCGVYQARFGTEHVEKGIGQRRDFSESKRPETQRRGGVDGCAH